MMLYNYSLYITTHTGKKQGLDPKLELDKKNGQKALNNSVDFVCYDIVLQTIL